MFSQSVEYALRAAVTLAAAKEPKKAADLAKFSQVPAAYLAKILLLLVRAGVARSLRGVHGGYVLAHPAGEVSVLDVVSAVEPMRRIFQCPLNRPMHGHCLCPLHRCLDDAMAHVEQSFRTTRLADLVEPATVVALGSETGNTRRREHTKEGSHVSRGIK